MFDQQKKRYVFITERSSPEVDSRIAALTSDRIRPKYIPEAGAVSEASPEELKFKGF